MELTNEERRHILRMQHAHLRRTIKAAQMAARGALAGMASAGELQVAVSALERELLAHLAEEVIPVGPAEFVDARAVPALVFIVAG